MKVKALVWLLLIGYSIQLNAQLRCGTSQYMQKTLQDNPSLQNYQQRIETFIQSRLSHSASSINARPAGEQTIKIPVVVHIVYHLVSENISDEAVRNQIEALNRDYRRLNADSINTPSYFKPVAADCNIEFELAKVDPQGKATTGIERIYSPVAQWLNDDKVKDKSQYGANGWNADSYLNIWVCNMYNILGYTSILGEAKKLDGVVIHYSVFNNINDGGDYNSGRTAVHEIGHWLGLKHIWGDADCGDDAVADTPKQSTYTSGCPGGIHTSCGNSANGDMYMNYMDYTNDPCMNLFTKGQKERMRALFDDGGYRASILSSKALGEPWTQEIVLPDSLRTEPQPAANIFPNPAASEITLDTKYDERWIGKTVTIMNVNGQALLYHTITSAMDKINVSTLGRGIYFIRGNKDWEKMVLKFIKL